MLNKVSRGINKRILNVGIVKFQIIASPLALLFAVAFVFMRCQQRADSDRVISKGEELSEVYCKSCHLYVGPEMLDRSSWIKVLGVMEKEMKKASMQVENADWLEVQRYYLENSPLILPQPSSKKKLKATKLFSLTEMLAEAPAIRPFVTMIKYDDNKHQLYIGDIAGNLFHFNALHYKSTMKIGDTPVDLHFDSDNDPVLLGVGNFMPYDDKKGHLFHLNDEGKHLLIDSLERPVHFTIKDFNADGVDEYLVSCFGSTVGDVNSGKLTLFTPDSGSYKEVVIKKLPGASKSVVRDFNQDNKLDIMALFAQGKEQISMFINRGDFVFEEKVLLEFLPVYGCNNFTLADINSDSHPDIILTNGDNGDSSPVFKFYHGVRVFINDGNDQFSEKYFYPIHGASKVLVRDFDADGDLDMVVLAMFPDLFRWSEETIVYFENKGDLDFEPAYIEKEPSGKWFLMDAGDVDHDGDEDLILGTNFRVNAVLLPPEYKAKWDSTRISYAIFRNNRFNGTSDKRASAH